MSARIPMQWAVGDRCVLRDELGRVEEIEGRYACVLLQNGRMSIVEVEALEMVPLATFVRCEATSKVRHASHAAAARNQRKVDRRKQCSIYRCDACHGWHLGNPRGVRSK